jgi:hypothetical protein
MRTRLAVLVILGLTVTSPNVRGQVPAPTRPGMPPRDVRQPAIATTSSGVIRGTVTSAETGSPVRRVNVAIERIDSTGRLPVQFLGARATVTDDRGQFTLSGIPAGFWRITATRSGYLTQVFGQRRPFEPPPPVIVQDDRELVANIALTRAGAINGRVVDEYGDPLAGVRVQPLRARMTRRQRHLEAVGNGDLTDDTGSFRLHGLAAGEYYVAASVRVAPLDSVVQTTYAPTYYPGTGRFAEAQKVFVGSGAEVNVDFPARPVRTVRITGFVQNSSGGPADAFLNLVSEAAELGVPLGVGSATREDGSFLLADVPPGDYTLFASLRGSGLDGEVGVTTLTVYEEDVSGVTVAMAKPGTMRVTIVPDAGVTSALPPSVDLVARSASAASETRHGVAGRVSSLPMTVPAGSFYLTADIPDRWALKAIVVDNTDLTDAPVDLKGRQDVPVRLVLTDKLTEVTGTVTLPGPGRTIGVVLFAEDSNRWRQPSRFIRSTTVDDRGSFRITGLPGSVRYLAVAVEALEEGEEDDPDFLNRMKDRAVSFPLAEGEERFIGLAVEERR